MLTCVELLDYVPRTLVAYIENHNCNELYIKITICKCCFYCIVFEKYLEDLTKNVDRSHSKSSRKFLIIIFYL
jgi:hypothetical protein